MFADIGTFLFYRCLWTPRVCIETHNGCIIFEIILKCNQPYLKKSIFVQKCIFIVISFDHNNVCRKCLSDKGLTGHSNYTWHSREDGRVSPLAISVVKHKLMCLLHRDKINKNNSLTTKIGKNVSQPRKKFYCISFWTFNAFGSKQ